MSQINDFLGDGRYLGYPSPGTLFIMKYRERLVWAGLFYVKDDFRASDLQRIINENQDEELNLRTVASALSKFVDQGHLSSYKKYDYQHTNNYLLTDLFKSLKVKHGYE